MKKLIALLIVLTITTSLSACMWTLPLTTPTETHPDIDGNPYTTHYDSDGNTVVSYDYSEVYESLDLSEYTSWGSFAEDGIMWVKKSDYKGTQYGYIDYKGNVIVPLTEEIISPGNFEYGYAIVSYERDGFGMGNGIHGVINKKGKVVFKFDNHAVSDWYQLPNGNIIFNRIDPISSVIKSGDIKFNAEAYMFISSREEVIALPGNVIDGVAYSDGLTRIYIRYNTGSTLPAVKFYNNLGNEVLSIDKDSNEYYKSVIYVSEFIDGKAYVIFWGMDRNYYKVSIDKQGHWIGEPIQIDKDQITDRFDM